ncbi:MAG: right-handed parallel beta-helix repeat-containing protein [Thermoguttaceae bacterium]|nr:right-handed parallel beta-helix repeat-containing protein [Thermoguttaceae bacterium]MDW8036631.1 right-handed parallel beta-helix repeat-containing protein [Thermoguttaceae bacterium]
MKIRNTRALLWLGLGAVGLMLGWLAWAAWSVGLAGSASADHPSRPIVMNSVTSATELLSLWPEGSAALPTAPDAGGPSPIDTPSRAPKQTFPAELVLGPQGFPADRSSVRDFGARGDGLADDAPAVQRAVDAKPGVLYFPPGTYRLSKTIEVELDKVGPLAIVGSSGVRIVMAGPGPAFRFVGTHQGTAQPASVLPPVWQHQRMPRIEGMEILGDHPEACGIQADGTMKLGVHGVLIRQVLHGVHLVRRNRNVLISQCHIYDNRGVGIYLDDVDLHQINVVGCHISYNKQGGIVSRAGNVRNLQVTGCDIETNVVNILLEAAGSRYGAAEVAITGCTIQHGNGPDSANVRILGQGEKYRWGHVCISGNVFSDVDINVHLKDAEDITVTGNTFWMAYRYNLLAENCSRLVISGNAFGRNPGYDYVKQVLPNALRLVGCQDVILQGIIVHDVQEAEAGLVLDACQRINVVGCNFVDCSGPGLLLRNVQCSRVSDCVVDHKTPPEGWVAIRVEGGRQNLLTGNLLGGILEMEASSGQAFGNHQLRPAAEAVSEKPLVPEKLEVPQKPPGAKIPSVPKKL